MKEKTNLNHMSKKKKKNYKKPKGRVLRSYTQNPESNLINYPKNYNESYHYIMLQGDNSQISGSSAHSNRAESQTFTPESLEVAIIDTRDLRGRILPEQVDMIMNELITMLDSSLISIGVGPKFENWIHEDGNLKITCENRRSLDWLLSTENQLQINSNGEYKIVSVDKIPRFVEITMIIPNEDVSDMEKVKRRMVAQNNHLHVDDWIMIKKEERGSDLLAVFGIPEVDANCINKTNCKIFYLFGTCKVQEMQQSNEIEANGSTICKTEIIDAL